LTWQAWATLAVVATILVLLMRTRVGPDIILLGGLTVLLTLGIVTPEGALHGLANEGMVTVGVMYIVVAGLSETGGMAWIVRGLLRRPRSLLGAQVRMMTPVAALSGFMNNTPLVAMFIPAIADWARHHRLSVSKLMIPLSYAAVLGGTCTLIGTSTNLVVNGLLIEETGEPAMGMFEIAWIGLPTALVGMAYILLFSRLLLPDRRPVMAQLQDPREYTVEMLVEPGSPLVGKTIEEAGLRHLEGMFLAEIEREGQVLPAVGPQERLKENDRLLFVGIVESVIELQRIRGLKPATDQVFKLHAPRTQRTLVEAVVSNSCRLVGASIREGQFRSVYNAVVIAVARNGERIRKKIGDIVLRPGDTLLLEATPAFLAQHRNSRDFFLVSRVENSTPLRHERAVVAVGILAVMVTVVTLGWLSMLNASMLAAGLMILTRCCSGSLARRTVDWSVLLTIAAALGIARALETTGAAETIAHKIIGMAGGDPWLTLAAVYGATMLFTELITNNAAAALIFPIAMATAESLGVNFRPFVLAIMMAASASFSTPIGYQTNLMVYGPGGYRFTDYFRIGIPLNLLAWATAVTIIPRVWPF